MTNQFVSGLSGKEMKRRYRPDEISELIERQCFRHGT
jgi:hypothetical protein